MKDTLLQNKKGVSEIISYVILIVIAISIGTLVFSYLSNLVPKDRPECKEGLSLSIEEAICSYNPSGESYLNLTVRNRGRFNIEAAYIRIGSIGNKTGYLINSEATNKFYYANGLKPNDQPLKNQYYFNTDNVLKDKASDYLLQIQIASYDKETKKYSACPNSITQTITCQ